MMTPKHPNKITLYGRVKIAFITLSVTALLSIIVSSWLYQELVYSEEKISIKHLVNLKYLDLENDLKSMMSQLGLALQSEIPFKQAVEQNNTQKIEQYLDNEYSQYFVTEDKLSLQKIYLLDKQLKFQISSSKGYKYDSLKEPICPGLSVAANKRKGADRLKAISMLCHYQGKAFLALIIPINTLSPIGYLQIVVDPVFNLNPIANSLSLELSIYAPNGNLEYQSENWPPKTESNNFIFTRFSINDNTEHSIIDIEVAKPVAEFQDRFKRTAVLVLSIAGILIFIVFLSTFRMLNRGFIALHELENGTQRVSSGDYQPLSDSEYREINSLIQAFNYMAKIIENSQSILKKEVRDATNDLQLALQRIAEKNTDLQTAMQLSEQANITKSAFLANMSHELRTPLNAIIGYSEMLKEEAEQKQDTEAIQDLDKIHTSGEHLLSLVNEILDLSKIEAGKVNLFIEDFDLVSIATEVIETVKPLAKLNNNVIDLNVSANFMPLKSDSMRVKQIFFNLISNACKFTSNGNIVVTINQEIEGKYNISIKDTGIGLKESELPDLFTAFTQADISTTRKYGGTGLGLALSKKMCELLGGHIQVNSVFGKGSEFIVQLPETI